MWNNIVQWARVNRWLAVVFFLSTLIAFPALTYFLFRWAFGSGGAGAGVGAGGSPLSFPWLFLGFASLVGAVFASNNTQSRVSYGILGLGFFCFILAIGPDYPLNVRLGRIMDQVLSSQGLALLALSAGVVFVLKNTTNPTATKVLVGVLGVMAIVFAIPLLKGAIDPTKSGFHALTGLEMNLNVVLLLTVIGILWKGDVQNRFVRFLLWLSLIIFIPASIAASVKVINDGLIDFANEVPILTDLPTYIPDSTPDWFKELWVETVPVLKGLPLGTKWGLLALVVLLGIIFLSVIFGSRRSATTPASSNSGLLGAFLAVIIIAVLVTVGYFALQYVVKSPPRITNSRPLTAFLTAEESGKAVRLMLDQGRDRDLQALTRLRDKAKNFESFTEDEEAFLKHIKREITTATTPPPCYKDWSKGGITVCPSQ